MRTLEHNVTKATGRETMEEVINNVECEKEIT